MIVTGGYYRENYNYIYHKDGHTIDLETWMWTIINFDGLFTPRARHCAFQYKDYLVIFAGRDENDEILGDL